MPTTTQPMAPVDAAWYHMDGATNLAMVTGAVLTRTPLDYQRVIAVYAHRILHLKQFRQRVVEKGWPIPSPHWEEDPYFNIDDHFRHVALPEPCDKQALMQLLSDLASTPLDYRRPLWQVHVIDRVDSGSAMVLRFHHCVGDGTAMIAVAQLLLDTMAGAPLDISLPPQQPSPSGLLDPFVRPVIQLADRSARQIGSALHDGLELLSHPAQVFELAQLAVGSAAIAVGTLLKRPDPPSPLKGRLGVPKRVAWSEPVPLAEVKAIGKVTGAKVNDVLVAATAGALRHYMQARQVDVEGMVIRAVVPVDLRPPDQAMELGNRFGLTFLDLPVGRSGVLQRLASTKHAMDAIKRSPEAAVFLGILDLFGRTPKAVEDVAVGIFGSKASLVLTNVPGPRQTLYLAGSAIERMIFWVPHPGKLGMGISILSYDGAVTLGVVADAGLVLEPDAITAEFNREFARMRAAVNSHVAGTFEGERCHGHTAAGRPCKNRPMRGSSYCRVHSSRAHPPDGASRRAS